MMLHTKYQGCGPCGFRQEFLSCFPNISLCILCDTLGRAIFGPRGIIYANLVKVCLVMQKKSNIKALGLVVSGKKTFCPKVII